MPSYVWYQDMADFAETISDEAVGAEAGASHPRQGRQRERRRAARHATQETALRFSASRFPRGSPIRITQRGALLAGLEARRDRVQRAAENAATELLRDDSLRQGHAAAIAAGEQAWTTLTTRLRTRLVDTIDRAELLPVWFDTVLGMTPPPEADAWLQTGTELLAYRTTYGVSNSVVALGPVPKADASRPRRDWHSS
jgi:hypothetical protein